MSRVHFFVDPGGIDEQTDLQKFGPVSIEEYRITSSFSIIGTPTAYATGKCRVLIQPQSGSAGRVNLILRPMEQPIRGLHIKYFIYRGLDEADFFATVGGDKIVIPAATGVSALISKVRTEFTNFHDLDQDPEPLFLAKFIGYDPAANGSLPIDDFFFKESDWNSSSEEKHFELPIAEAGMAMGRFTGTECGIDIILDYGDYKPAPREHSFQFDLAYARLPFATIKAIGTEEEKKVIQQSAYDFLDVSAFYGYFHASADGIGYGPLNNSTSAIGNAIYTILIQKLKTKNNVYIYIFGDRERYYNFYGNNFLPGSSSASVKFGIEPSAVTPLTSMPFAASGNWPLIIDAEARTGGAIFNTVFIQLRCQGDKGILYLRSGSLMATPQDEWLLANDLEAVSGGGLTKEVQLTTAAYNNKNISCFYFLLYRNASMLAKVNGEEHTDLDSKEIKSLDQFVYDFNRTALFQDGVSNNADAHYVDRHVSVGRQQLDPGNQRFSIVETISMESTAVVDAATLNVTSYFAYEISILYKRQTANLSDVKLYPSYTVATAGLNSLATRFFADFSVIRFTDGTTQASVLSPVIDEENPLAFFLGLSKQEKELLQQVVNDNSLINASIYFSDDWQQAVHFESVEGIRYGKYKLALLAEGNGNLRIFFPSTDIYVYSIREGIANSAAYGTCLEQLVPREVSSSLDGEYTLFE